MLQDVSENQKKPSYAKESLVVGELQWKLSKTTIPMKIFD
jgi:hypothetical protein